MSTQNLLRRALLGLFLLGLPLLSLSASDPPLSPFNPRLEKAYVALQAWKHVITSDPKNLTLNWCGPFVCNYTGVYCAAAPDDPHVLTVAGIDLNHGRIAGTLPEHLGLLTDLALFHINSNRFEGTLPTSFDQLKRLFELDVSNNRLEGPFPSVVLRLPSLKFLDIRYNKYHGDVPAEVFDLPLDAFFINSNQFRFSLPENIGNSLLSVLVAANNQLSGCFPTGITKLAKTLNQIILINSNITSCIPPEIGQLDQLTVFDVSYNNLVGPLPDTIGNMKKLEQLDVAHNQLSGYIPETICELPRLKNFTYSYNYFSGAPEPCKKIMTKDDEENCIPSRPKQKSEEECYVFLTEPVYCSANGCIAPPPTPPPPPPPPPHYHY